MFLFAGSPFLNDVIRLLPDVLAARTHAWEPGLSFNADTVGHQNHREAIMGGGVT